MHKVTIRYKHQRTLKALKGIAKYFDFEIEGEDKPANKKQKAEPPITYAKNPDFKALAGIWKDKNITIEQLRDKAWGGRK